VVANNNLYAIPTKWVAGGNLNSNPPEMYTIFCLLEGRGGPFPIDINETQTVAHLKKEIKKEKAVALADVDADDLKLYHVNFKYDDSDEQARITQVNKALQDLEPLRPMRKLSNIENGFPEVEDLVHVLVQLPPSESINSRVAEMLRSAQLVRLWYCR
jgi:hypothetical protein